MTDAVAHVNENVEVQQRPPASNRGHRKAHQTRPRVPACPLRDHFHTEYVGASFSNAQIQQFPEWMDLKTTQSYISASERTLRAWIHRELDPLPAVQDGGKIFISRSRLDRWMLNHAVPPESNREVGEIVNEVLETLTRVQ